MTFHSTTSLLLCLSLSLIVLFTKRGHCRALIAEFGYCYPPTTDVCITTPCFYKQQVPINLKQHRILFVIYRRINNCTKYIAADIDKAEGNDSRR